MQNTTGPGSANLSFSTDDGFVVKAFLSMTPCFLFLYVNIIMLFTLWSKKIFCETPRYILFGHLLLSESVQLSSDIVAYMLAVKRLYMATYGCVLNHLVHQIIVFFSPFYLALMSLERCIAICCPLRHAEIANVRRTNMAVIGVWLLCMAMWTAELTANFMFEILSPTKQMFCSNLILLKMEISVRMNQAFTAIIFMSVSLVMICTYIAILMTAKSAISDKTSVTKAHRTVLLHMFQLGLCLISTVFTVIRRALAISKLRPLVKVQIVYILFVGVVIVPRCLSPLIYGLRDKTFCAFFKYYFFWCLRAKVEPSIAVI